MLNWGEESAAREGGETLGSHFTVLQVCWNVSIAKPKKAAFDKEGNEQIREQQSSGKMGRSDTCWQKSEGDSCRSLQHGGRGSSWALGRKE